MTSRVRTEMFPTISLEKFLEQHDLSLNVVENRRGFWFAELVGAKRPPYSIPSGNVYFPPVRMAATPALTGECQSQPEAVQKALATLNNCAYLIRPDGTEIDMRNLRITDTKE